MNTHYFVVESFIESLIGAGVSSFVLSPGSRSTPLAVYAARQAREGRISLHILTDERSAGFFALGMAKAESKPAVLICTSGTAAANYLPAVVEAHYSHMPLIVLTADRPPEARDVGAAQTIDQVGLFGPFAKWSVDMPLPENLPDIEHYFRTTAVRAYAETMMAPTGPVHINLPFREPLIPPPADRSQVLCASPSEAAGNLSYGAPQRPAPDQRYLEALAADLSTMGRGLLICGPQSWAQLAPAAVRLSASLGIPLLADPLSQIRFGPHDRETVIDAYDIFLRDPDLQERLAPDYVIRLGALPTSKPLNTFLKSHSVRHIVVDPNVWSDPFLCATDMVRSDAGTFCELFSAVSSPSFDASWLGMWQKLNQITRHHIEQVVTSLPGLFEGRVFPELTSIMAEDSTLFVGNSMPIRDLDTFGGSTDVAIRTMANRGANGIDGVLSTALGAAVASNRPLVLVLGDLSMLHDLGALAAAKTCRVPVVIVVVNNDGGGIFSFLPQARKVEDFETLFGTPHGIQFEHAAALFGLSYAQPRDWKAFRNHVTESLQRPGVSIIEITSNRNENYTLHQDVHRRVLEAVKCSLNQTE